VLTPLSKVGCFFFFHPPSMVSRVLVGPRFPCDRIPCPVCEGPALPATTNLYTSPHPFFFNCTRAFRISQFAMIFPFFFKNSCNPLELNSFRRCCQSPWLCRQCEDRSVSLPRAAFPVPSVKLPIERCRFLRPSLRFPVRTVQVHSHQVSPPSFPP